MKTKKKQTMMEQLREIRDQISLETMDMNFEQLENYFEERKKRFEQKQKGKSYKTSGGLSMIAEPKVKYGRK